MTATPLAFHDKSDAIGEVAGRQDNVITREQLLSIGIGRGAIAHACRTPLAAPTQKRVSDRRRRADPPLPGVRVHRVRSRALVELTRAAALPPPLLNQRLLGYVADFLCPQRRLVMEVDGYKYHRHRAAFERDRKRDQVMVSAGYLVLRVTWRQLRDEPLFVVARLAQALNLTAARG
jgi:Protein of unknown function (DUF559)